VPFLAVGLAIAVPLLRGSLPVVSDRVDEADYFDDTRREVVAEALDAGATSFTAAGVTADNPLWQFVNVAVGPLPMAWRNLPLLLAGFDAVLWIALWALAVLGYRYTTTSRWGVVLSVVPALALLVYLSISLTNFGLIMRLRALGLPFLAPLAAVGIALLIERLRRPRTPSGPDLHT
jgi:hypothetical protein